MDSQEQDLLKIIKSHLNDLENIIEKGDMTENDMKVWTISAQNLVKEIKGILNQISEEVITE